ncbi:MAG: DUF58 domain-containing protein [Pseudomonadota bacterium]
MIKPDRRFIILTICLFCFSFLFGGSLPFHLSFAALAMLVLSWLYIRALWKSFDVEITCDETVLSAGGTTDVLTKVKFGLPLPVPYVEIRGDAFTASGSGYSSYLRDTTWDENIWIKNELRFSKRGLHKLDNIFVRVSDVFRIICFEKTIDTDITIKVFPKIYNIAGLPQGGIDIYRETADLNSRSEDQNTIRDVRKYREGDSLKKVHWKLSAKQDELYVKNLDTISGEEIVLFVDMNCRNYSLDDSGAVEESVVDFSVSIINQIIRKNLSIKVFLNTSKGSYFEVDDKSDFNRFMDFLVSQVSDGSLELYQYIYENSYRLHRMNRIAVVAAALDESLSEALLHMGASGYSISVFYCMDNPVNREYSSSLTNAGIECSHIKDRILQWGMLIQ